jgi:r-opsin
MLIGACFGYNQIFTLTMISYDRYNVIVKGFSGTPLTFSMISLTNCLNLF